MAAAFSNAKIRSKDSALLIVTATLALSGSYPTGGDTLPDFATLPNIGLFKNANVIDCSIKGQGGALYQWMPGTTSANHKVKCLVEQTVATNALLGEHTATTYVAGISGDTIQVTILLSLEPR